MKRFTVVIVVLILMFSLVPVSASAASPVISIGSAEVYAGETAGLNVSIQGNPGITALYLNIRYDSRLKLTAVKDNGIFKGKSFSENISAVPFVLSWDDSLSQADNTANGTAAQLVFSVPQGTPAGTYKVSVSYDKDEIFNSKLENINFATADGEITVKQNKVLEDSDDVYRSGEYLHFVSGKTVSDIKNMSQRGTYVSNQNGKMSDSMLLCSGNTVYFPDKSAYVCLLFGDMNGDGNINAADARLTLRGSVGLEVFSPWQNKAADVDFSEAITASDARLILRASVGLEDADRWVKGFSEDIIYITEDLAPADKNTVTSEANYNAAGSLITSQLKAFNTKVELGQFSVHLDDATLLIKEFVNVVPELFYVINSVTVMSRDGIIENMEFSFIDNAKEKSAEYKKLIASVALQADKNWSTVQKIVYFHDYICSNYKYDDSLSIYDAYSLLKQGKGVCQAYTLLLKALLNYHGIESKYVSSEKMKHGWNIVKIGSDWYHVDATWDDPQDDRYGLALHENLLLSDKAMEKNGHKDWYCFGGNEICSNTYYDEFFWQDITSPFVNLNDKWYYIDTYSSGYGIFEWRDDSNGIVEKSFSAKWTGFLGIVRSGCFSCLGVYENKLVYNTADSVVSYDPHTGKQNLLYKENTSDQIFGLNVKDRIYINLDSSPDSSTPDIRAVDRMSAGDCDGNGKINGRDYTVLLRYLSGYNTECITSNGDFDLNGKLNTKDADAIRRFIVDGET